MEIIPGKQTKPEVLLVDDNPADVDLTRDVLERCSHPHQVGSVADGAEALDFLHRKGRHASAPSPDLILLDLNLPLKHGRDVLRAVKNDPSLCQTPVVIFSTSSAPSDIQSSFELGANSYVTKPGNLQDFVSAVTSIGEFWLGCALLPPKEES